MTQKIKLAISTCPNDTFAFHGLINRNVDWQGLDFDIQLLDIQQLNDGLFDHQFDVAKASFHAAALLAEETIVLPSGSAIGFGVGPLLLGASRDTKPSSENLTLCPGEHTTATLLFRTFYGASPKVNQVVFSNIMPALISNEAQFGVCIHEGRFTWESQGLSLVEDLGERWERETESPLPLGGILAARTLDEQLIGTIQSVIKSSIDYGLKNRNAALATMRRYAQEFDDRVLFQHVDLYVNDWTIDLGEIGANSLRLLSSKARAMNAISDNLPDIEVWNPNR